MIWGETGRPGYGLYDRALGAVYLNGLWEAMEKFAWRSAVGGRNGPVDHFERRTPRVWASGHADSEKGPDGR